MWERTRQIATQSVYPIASRDLVPQAFQLNRSLSVIFCQQGRGNFSATYNSASCSTHAFGCSHNEIAYHLITESSIGYIVDRQSRQSIGGVQRNITPLFDSRCHVHTLCFQFWNKAGSV